MQRRAAHDAAKAAQAVADNTGEARPTTTNQPAGAEIGPDSEGTTTPTHRPAEFEQASSFEIVVISTVSVCPHASQLLATAMPMDLQREDLVLDETGRAALATTPMDGLNPSQKRTSAISAIQLYFVLRQFKI